MIMRDGDDARKMAASIIRSGGVIAFRTDTFYGLGADPFNRDAIVRIRELKGREDDKPILLLVSDESEVDRFIEQSDFFRLIAKGHWPAPLTLIGFARPEVPIELTAGAKRLGVRLPGDDDVGSLRGACGGGLEAHSADVSGPPPGGTRQEGESFFPAGSDL